MAFDFGQFATKKKKGTPEKPVTVVKPKKVVPKEEPKTPMILQIPLIQTPPLILDLNNMDLLRSYFKQWTGKSSRKETKLELVTIFNQVFGEIKEELLAIMHAKQQKVMVELKE